MKTLYEVEPRYVVLYDAEVQFVRQLEVCSQFFLLQFAAKHHMVTVVCSIFRFLWLFITTGKCFR